MTNTAASDIFLKRDANLMLRLNKRIKLAVRELAAREGVPMTTLVEDLILEELRRKGVAVEVESLKVV
jgi:predicted DNA binding CopG/RHH family protein